MSQPLYTRTATSARTVGVLMLVGASLLWSISGVVVKWVKMDPVGFAFWRSLAAGVAMLLVLPLSRGAAPHAGWMSLTVLLHATVVTLLIKSMTSTTAAAGIILQYTGPVFCALFAWIFQGRRLTGRTSLALGIAMIGVAIMLIGGMRAGTSAVGLVTGAISGVAFGALILTLEVVNRTAPAGAPVNPFLIVTLNNLGTAAIVLPIAFYSGRVFAEPWQLAVVSATGLVQLAIPYVLFVLALRRVEPVDASLLILLEPVLNPVWALVFIGERPNLPTLFGGGAILTAMLIEAVKSRE